MCSIAWTLIDLSSCESKGVTLAYWCRNMAREHTCARHGIKLVCAGYLTRLLGFTVLIVACGESTEYDFDARQTYPMAQMPTDDPSMIGPNEHAGSPGSEIQVSGTRAIGVEMVIGGMKGNDHQSGMEQIPVFDDDSDPGSSPGGSPEISPEIEQTSENADPHL